jgi:hypothetical protein
MLLANSGQVAERREIGSLDDSKGQEGFRLSPL